MKYMVISKWYFPFNRFTDSPISGSSTSTRSSGDSYSSSSSTRKLLSSVPTPISEITNRKMDVKICDDKQLSKDKPVNVQIATHFHVHITCHGALGVKLRSFARLNDQSNIDKMENISCTIANYGQRLTIEGHIQHCSTRNDSN